MVASVLFVCMANICRSPALEAALRHLAVQKNCGEKIRVDSCGIGWVHLGERPSAGMFESAKKQGILVDHRAQQFQDHFFEEFDYILAVTEDVAEQLKMRSADPDHRKKVLLATHFSPRFKGQEIVDPYYMGKSGQDEVMEVILDCCQGLLKHLIEQGY